MAAGLGSFLDLLDPEDRVRYGSSVAALGSDAGTTSASNRTPAALGPSPVAPSST